MFLFLTQENIQEWTAFEKFEVVWSAWHKFWSVFTNFIWPIFQHFVSYIATLHNVEKEKMGYYKG